MILVTRDKGRVASADRGRSASDEDTKMANDGSYKSRTVWQKSVVLVKRIYLLTGGFPAEEKFGIVSQVRRVAVSVPSNIADGQARRTTGDYIRFVSNAEGSLPNQTLNLLFRLNWVFVIKLVPMNVLR